MADTERRLKRWFGKEHNPKRASLVRQGIRYQLPADGLVGVGVLLWNDVGALAGITFVVLGLTLFGISVKKLVQGLREPHWGSPLQTKRR